MLNVIENLKLTHKFALILMASTFTFNGNADEKQLAQLSEGFNAEQKYMPLVSHAIAQAPPEHQR